MYFVCVCVCMCVCVCVCVFVGNDCHQAYPVRPGNDNSVCLVIITFSMHFCGNNCVCIVERNGLYGALTFCTILLDSF